jgi:hypothetical protein
MSILYEVKTCVSKEKKLNCNLRVEERQRDRKTKRQNDRKTERQKDRKTEMQKDIEQVKL